jgi:HEPN domain-containing protein
MANESVLPLDWIKEAEKDINRVRIMLSAQDFGDAGFHLQQAVEKYLKAYLLAKGWELEKTHDLVKLINYAIKYNPKFEDFVSLCETVTEYYIEERYPFIIKSELTKVEIEENLERAKTLIYRILDELGLSKKFNRENL